MMALSLMSVVPDVACSEVMMTTRSSWLLAVTGYLEGGRFASRQDRSLARRRKTMGKACGSLPGKQQPGKTGNGAGGDHVRPTFVPGRVRCVDGARRCPPRPRGRNARRHRNRDQDRQYD